MVPDNNYMAFWQKILLLSTTVLAAFFIVVTTLAPVRKLKEFKDAVVTDSVYFNQNRAIIKHSGLVGISRIKAFNEAQIAIAKDDSIGLVINLNDSTVNLMLKGIKIHVSKIDAIQKDKFFDALYPMAYTKIFSNPLIILSEYSSIVKEPIVVKKAPKNEEEALAMATIPEMPIQNPAYFSMFLSSGFNLILIQNEWLSKEEKAVKRKFKKDIRNRKLKDKMYGILHLKNASYTPTIILMLKAEEISSIYRAIPVRANIVIYY